MNILRWVKEKYGLFYGEYRAICANCKSNFITYKNQKFLHIGKYWGLFICKDCSENPNVQSEIYPGGLSVENDDGFIECRLWMPAKIRSKTRMIPKNHTSLLSHGGKLL